MSVEQVIEQAEKVVENKGNLIMRGIIERFNGSTDLDEKDNLISQAQAEHARQDTSDIPDEGNQIITLFERRKKAK